MRIAGKGYFTAFYIDPENPTDCVDELDIVEVRDARGALEVAIDHMNDLWGTTRLRGVTDGFGVSVFDFGTYGATQKEASDFMKGKGKFA